MGDYFRVIPAHGQVVVAHVFDTEGDLIDVAVFGSMEKAMVWAESKGGDGDVINCCPFLIDNPDFGTMHYRLQ